MTTETKERLTLEQSFATTTEWNKLLRSREQTSPSPFLEFKQLVDLVSDIVDIRRAWHLPEGFVDCDNIDIKYVLDGYRNEHSSPLARINARRVSQTIGKVERMVGLEEDFAIIRSPDGNDPYIVQMTTHYRSSAGRQSHIKEVIGNVGAGSQRVAEIAAYEWGKRIWRSHLKSYSVFEHFAKGFEPR